MLPQTDNVAQCLARRVISGAPRFDYGAALQPVGRAVGVASRERVTEDCLAVPVSISGTLTSVVVTSTDANWGGSVVVVMWYRLSGLNYLYVVRCCFVVCTGAGAP